MSLIRWAISPVLNALQVLPFVVDLNRPTDVHASHSPWRLGRQRVALLGSSNRSRGVEFVASRTWMPPPSDENDGPPRPINVRPDGSLSIAETAFCGNVAICFQLTPLSLERST